MAPDNISRNRPNTFFWGQGRCESEPSVASFGGSRLVFLLESVQKVCYSVVRIVLERDERAVGKRSCDCELRQFIFLQDLRQRSFGERWFWPVGEMQVIGEGRDNMQSASSSRKASSPSLLSSTVRGLEDFVLCSWQQKRVKSRW